MTDSDRFCGIVLFCFTSGGLSQDFSPCSLVVMPVLRSSWLSSRVVITVLDWSQYSVTCIATCNLQTAELDLSGPDTIKIRNFFTLFEFNKRYACFRHPQASGICSIHLSCQWIGPLESWVGGVWKGAVIIHLNVGLILLLIISAAQHRFEVLTKCCYDCKNIIPGLAMNLFPQLFFLET